MSAQRVKYWVGDSVWKSLRDAIDGHQQIAIITDNNVANLYSTVLMDNLGTDVTEMGELQGDKSQQLEIFTIDAGEASKSYQWLEKITDWLLQLEYRRECLLVALGGGVVGDLTGLVASVYLRGVNYIQVPTSLLAMADSSIGGKTAIDTKYGKNTVGTFYYPTQVLTGIEFLSTLPKEEFANGMAEILKIALVLDQDFWNLLRQYSLQSLREEANLGVLREIVRKSQELKRQVTEEDFQESSRGRRQWLNFGHTVGHAIELATGWRHGYAVSVGMVREMAVYRLLEEAGDAPTINNGKPDTGTDIDVGYYSHRIQAQETLRREVVATLEQYLLPTVLPEFSLTDALGYLARDKKSGRLVTVSQGR